MRRYLFIAAGIGWFAVILQLYLIIVNRVTPVAETIIRFFSFFTILTNILVAVCFTSLLMRPGFKWRYFFLEPKALTAIAVYMTIVGGVYNLVLRSLWNPQGLQKLADELLHSVLPLLVVGYWLIFVPKNEVKWKNALAWLIYPSFYLIYILLRGAFSRFYPYPFINVNDLGYNVVFLNSGILLAVFLLTSLLFISIGKLTARIR